MFYFWFDCIPWSIVIVLNPCLRDRLLGALLLEFLPLHLLIDFYLEGCHRLWAQVCIEFQLSILFETVLTPLLVLPFFKPSFLCRYHWCGWVLELWFGVSCWGAVGFWLAVLDLDWGSFCLGFLVLLALLWLWETVVVGIRDHRLIISPIGHLLVCLPLFLFDLFELVWLVWTRLK